MEPSKRFSLRSFLCLSLSTVLSVAFNIFISCDDGESFTQSPDALLTMPFDTLRIDTAISGVATSTYSFVVRNKGKHGIKIVKASLDSDGASGFQANVDGTNINDSYGYSIEVRAKDSITVYVKLKAKESGSDDAQPVEDCISFLLESGVVQKIKLLGYSQDVVTLNNVTIDCDTTLQSAKPVHVVGQLTVNAENTLTIAPGTTLLFSPASELVVEGTLRAMGTIDSPVVFRGDRLDYMFVNQPYDRISGQWQGIVFKTSSYGNVLNHCDIHSASYGVKCDSSNVDAEKLKIENSVVHNMKGDCLTFVNSNVFVGNSQITNALGNCVTLYGGTGHFVHCTIGNFYPFEGTRGRALYLYNSVNGRPLPLKSAKFENCIISGWSEDELFASFLDDDTEKIYQFRSCLLTTPKVDDSSNYPNCIFENSEDSIWGSGNFRKFNYDNLVFDFRLDSLSKARNAGDVAITRQFYPEDIAGNARLDDDGKSDIGCYEFKSE